MREYRRVRAWCRQWCRGGDEVPGKGIVGICLCDNRNRLCRVGIIDTNLPVVWRGYACYRCREIFQCISYCFLAAVAIGGGHGIDACHRGLYALGRRSCRPLPGRDARCVDTEIYRIAGAQGSRLGNLWLHRLQQQDTVLNRKAVIAEIHRGFECYQTGVIVPLDVNCR